MNSKIETFILPAFWASYLINGDASGLADHEKAECDQWMEKHGNPNFVDCGTPCFSWCNDANARGGDVCEFRSLKR